MCNGHTHSTMHTPTLAHTQHTMHITHNQHMHIYNNYDHGSLLHTHARVCTCSTHSRTHAKIVSVCVYMYVSVTHTVQGRRKAHASGMAYLLGLATCAALIPSFTAANLKTLPATYVCLAEPLPLYSACEARLSQTLMYSVFAVAVADPGLMKGGFSGNPVGAHNGKYGEAHQLGGFGGMPPQENFLISDLLISLLVQS